MNLSNFPTEVLRVVTHMLPSVAVGRMYLCGNLLLSSKLEQTRAVESLNIALDSPQPKWPSIVTQLRYLEHLTIKCLTNGPYTPISNFEAHLIPKEVRSLRFHFANDFSGFFERDLDSCDVDHYNADGIRLKDMSEMFPHLETLEFIGTVVHLPLQDTFPSFLPQTLTRLRLTSNYEISAYMISLLPRTLLDLECRFRRYGQDFDPDFIEFPPNLTSFIVYRLKTMTILPLLPHSITSLKFMELDDDTFAGWDVLYEHLPTELTTLHTTVNIFNVTFTRFLPRSLTELDVDFEEFQLEALKYLPPNLRSWTTCSGFNGLILKLWNWQLLPKTIEIVPNALSNEEIMPGLDPWKFLPVGLREVTLNLEMVEIDEMTWKQLPSRLETLSLIGLSSQLDKFDWTSFLSASLTSLKLDRPQCSLELSHSLVRLEKLTTLRLKAPAGAIHEQFYLNLPPALTSLETVLMCELPTLLKLSDRWPRNLNSLMLHQVRSDFNLINFYAFLPSTLTQLSIRDQDHALPSTHFRSLPRGLLHFSVIVLNDGLCDEELASLPPKLRSLRIFQSHNPTFTIKGLLLLPMTLEIVKLPPQGPMLREAELFQFVQERPCIFFRLGLVSPSCSEAILKEYERKNLTLGNMTIRHRYIPLESQFLW